jgi:NTP pyrophosphohydrolases including oxidative damage repair enzymes
MQQDWCRDYMGRFPRTFKKESGISQPLQVAAICYRANGSNVEFLLVNTSSGKWTFPKGRLEAALSASESAAAEAWEEAGARGVIGGESFGFYLDTKRSLGISETIREITIAAYLMEVHSAVVPQESGRNPSWFAPHEAKCRLSESRAVKYSETLHKIVDAAIQRISTAPPVAYSSKQHPVAHLR